MIATTGQAQVKEAALLAVAFATLSGVFQMCLKPDPSSFRTSMRSSRNEAPDSGSHRRMIRFE
jgi:hypothetical protein